MLPMFPLPMVVFPGETVNLHIFEPRYRQLIQECASEGISFGIPPFIDQKLMRVGTEMELVRIKRTYPQGEMDIETKALGLFEILAFSPVAPGKLYGGATVRPFPFEQAASDAELSGRLLEMLQDLYRQLLARKRLPDQAEALNSFEVAHHVGLSLQQEYKLLETPSETERQRLLVEHLSAILPVVKEKEDLQRKIRMNGHFKNFIPPRL